ncbi:MAG: relaxase/mobilization nuclease domain-containing protein [Pseudomonadota bacterium]
MVKVLSGGGQDLGAVRRHLDYLGRAGEIELETDDGERLQGKGTERALLEDWDLDLDSDRRQADLSAANGRQPPKMVHKLIFSMPPGTPPDKLQAAVRNLAREEFALKHRYVMVLHTDEPHPHVHMVVKAVSEQGVRLNIRKATLRAWRREFARHLREQGVAANATERVVRGETRTPKMDGIYRAMRRGDSSHMRERVRAAAAEAGIVKVQAETGKARLIATRLQVEKGWRALENILVLEGHAELARSVSRFVLQMQPPRTDKEHLAQRMSELSRAQRVKEIPATR